MANLIQLRRDTAANWTLANPILAQGEPGVELVTNKWKIGNGIDVWVDLPYQGTQLPTNNAGYLYNNGTGTLTWGPVPIPGTVTSVGMNMGTTGFSVSPAAITTTGTFAITGTLAVLHGGTGATSATAALTNLLPDQTGNNGKFLSTNGTVTSWSAIPQNSRATVSVSTGSIASNNRVNVSVTGHKGYMLYKIQTSDAAWVTLYANEAARTADATRSFGTTPATNSGVIADVVTTGAETVVISPAVCGFNDEASPTTNIPMAIANRTLAAADISVTLTILKIE